MKKLFLAILFLFSLAFIAEACRPENPEKTANVDGVCYGYDGGEWYVRGFEQDQDSVVLKHKVVINGEKVKVEEIYIQDYMNNTASPRILVIPKGFKAVAQLYLPKLEKLYISKTIIRTHDVCTSEYAAIYSEKLEAIIVDPKNKNLKSVDGILFSKDGTNLLKYPAKKAEKEYSIPDDVESICYGAFSGCQLEIVYYPKQKGGIENYEQYGLSDPYEEAVDKLGFELGKTKFIGR